MKYEPSNSKFVSFSCMSFIKICLVWNFNTVFDKTCLNKMSIIWQNRRTMFQPDMDSWLTSISHPEYLLLVYLVQPFWARHLQNTRWLLNIIVRSSKQRWLSVSAVCLCPLKKKLQQIEQIVLHQKLSLNVSG